MVTRNADNASQALATLSLGALGVVFGDIGTSPLYALKDCFSLGYELPVTPVNVLGVLSLIVWALVLVISLKYCLYVLRADNKGEGGVLALMALVHPRPRVEGRDPLRWLIFLGLFGAALLYGDGVITPAISVLSAVEGLEISAPVLQPFVLPIAVLVLSLLFAIQRIGTDRIGKAFGPILLLWFLTLAALGIRGVLSNPQVLAALNPYYAVLFAQANGWKAFLVLGSVFLVVTGGEALYADMGHFGRRPITFAWFTVVFPSLILNYLGQGALLLKDPSSAENPFFLLAPPEYTLPLVVLSTVAAVIASQALISGTYTLTQQAIQLGYLPRQKIRHTSSKQIGQIYLPRVNIFLLLGSLSLVLFFRSSSGLASAYGLSVTATMIVTTILTYYVARYRWKLGAVPTITLTSLFLLVDASFFSANVLKIFEGAWVSLVIALVMFTAMTTWRRGRFILGKRLREKACPVSEFIQKVESDDVHRVPGVAVFMTSVPDSTPPSLIHNLRHNHVVHELTILMTVVTESIPFLHPDERVDLKKVYDGVYALTLHYGFMERPDVPAALREAFTGWPSTDYDKLSYFLGRETLVASRNPAMNRWRTGLFSYMTQNSQKATDFYQLPSEQVFEVGILVELSG